MSLAALGHSLRPSILSAALLLVSIPTAKADSVTPATILEGPAAGSTSVVLVKTNTTATWTSTSNAPWLHVTATGDYATNHLQPFTFDANTGATRTGTLTVDGATITVTQLGATYTPTTAAPTLLNRTDTTRAMAVDQAGNLYFSDGSIIEKWTAATNTVSTIVSSGIVLTMGMTADAAGNLYIADQNANKVLKWTATTSTLSTLVSTGLSGPYSVALDAAGNLYIADYFTIWKRPAAGGQLTQAFYSGKTAGMVFDAKGSLYIATNDGQSGTPKLIKKGTPGDFYPPTVSLGQVTWPYGLATDPWGNLLIADFGNGTPSGAGALRQWNPATAPTTNNVIISDVVPFRIAVDNQGTIFVTDFIGSSNWPVRAKPRAFVDTRGTIVPLAGGSGSLPAVQPATTYLTGPFAPTADQPWITIGAISNGVINFTAAANGAVRYSYVTVLGQKMLVQQGTPSAPTITTPTSANITVLTATLGGNVTVEGGSPVTARGVVFARTVDNTNPQIGGSGGTTLSDTAPGLGVFTVNATGLLSNTGYTYRAFVTTAYGGTVYTSTATFTTQAATLATLAAPTVSNLGNDSVTLNGNITDGGNTAVTARGLVYARTSQNNNPQIGGANVIVLNDATGGAGTFSAALSSLAYSTGYSFKAFATNTAGTQYSSVTNFTTLDPTYTLGTSSVIDGADAGADSVVLGVTPVTGPWSASSNAGWLHLNAGSTSGTGSALITFTIDDNTGATRTGTLTIAGQTLTVTQAANGYTAVTRATQLGTGLGAGASGIAVDGSGNVFANPSNGNLVKWNPVTNVISTVGGQSGTYAMATDAAGNVYLTSPQTLSGGTIGTILKWAAPAGPVTTVATSIRSFSGVAVDSKGNIWSTTDYDGLKKATPSGTVTTVQAISGVAGGVAIDVADNVYWVDNERPPYGAFYLRVYKRDSNTGAVSLLIPTGFIEYCTGLAVDGSGNLYIMNNDLGMVYKWTAVTNTLAPVLSGLSLPQSFSSKGLAADRTGNVYVADNVNNRLIELPRVFVPSSNLNVGNAAGNGVLPAVIPSTALTMAPFTPTSESSWLHIDSNTLGIVGYSYDASATARYSYLNIGGQRILVQQGTPSVPTVTTPTSTGITPTTATLGGNIAADGGAPILSYGFVLAPASQNIQLQIGGPGVIPVYASNNLGVLAGTVPNLLPNTTYAYAAFAGNVAGTGYTSVSMFTTAAYDSSVSLSAGDVVFTTAPQRNGKLLVGGRSQVVRLDPSYNADAFYYLNGSSEFVNCLLSLADNSFIMAGSFTAVEGQARTNMARYDGSGALDSFAPNVNGSISCMALQSDGSILIGGEFTQVNGMARNRIARLYSNGTLDLSFNPNANSPVRSIAIQPDGKVIVGGGFTLVGTTLCNRIARLTSAGVVDATFAASADASVDVIVLQPDNRILISGAFSSLNSIARPYFARLNPNGTLDNSFAPTTNNKARSIALQADGQVFIGGSFTTVADQPRIGLARLRADGTLADYYASVTDNSDAASAVNTVMIAADGRVIIGGEFNKISGSYVNYAASLLNSPVVQTLAPGGSKTVEWERSTSLPEVQDASFELSTDGGGTWTTLGNGTRTAGGWSLSSAPTLPSTGILRASARTLTGIGNGSGGWISVESPFSLADAEIVVEQPVNTDLSSGANLDLGTLGQGVSVLTTFTVRNSGGFSLTGLNATISGTHAAMFSVTKQPATSLDSFDSTTFIVQAKLTSPGPKAATINLTSNDANESPFLINLTATGAVAVPPVVTTTNASDIRYSTATANGTVDAKGSLREVFIDYGLTTSYGNSVTASPATTTTSGSVSAALTGLLPHKTYNYRVRADGDLGNAFGANKTFTTLNNTPVGTNDTAIIQPGATGSIDVLANDTDADADLLTILAKTTVTPIAAGTVTITANQLVFTASTTFSGTATFGYTLSDGFGGSATASVTVSTGSITIDPLTASYPSAAVTYPIEITANGAWAVSESLAWASVSQTRGTGKTIIQITLQPNATTIARPGTIKIGSATHTVTQAGVVTPVIGPLSGTYDTIVGENIALTIPTQNAPVTYTVTGTVPPGLALDQATGIISGTPTKDGIYPLSVKAKNLAGNAAATLNFTIAVAKLPAGVVGTFHGYVERSATARFSADPNLGARFEMTTTANGGVSGSVIEGVSKKSFTMGKIVSNFATPNTPAFSAALTGTNLFIDITFDAVNNTAAGILRNSSGQSSAAITAWRNGWSTVLPIVKASDYKAQHTFSLQNTNNANGPQGYGFGSFIVNEATGVLNITGSLPDGSPLLCSTFVGQKGEVLLYQALHANRGSCFGKLEIVKVNAPADNTLSGNLTWLKPASLPAAKDLVYSSGFGALPLSLTALGGALPAPLKGQRLLGVPDAADNARLVFDGTSANAAFNQLLRIINPNNTTGTTNTATISLPNINSVALPALTFATGDFKGSFILPGTTLATNRIAPFFGQLVRTGGTIQGYGYYLMPTGTPTTTSTRVSGSVELKTP